jgi:hypothetical protein
MNLAQSQIKGAIKDSSNPFFKSSYADLESVMTALREPCAKNGLSYTQMTDFISTGTTSQLCVVTRIMHSSGEWLEGYFPIVPGKPNDPQALGSATSYARRFSLSAAFGVFQVDDDAEKTQTRTNNYPTKVTPQRTTAPTPAKSSAPQNFADMDIPF